MILREFNKNIFFFLTQPAETETLTKQEVTKTLKSSPNEQNN